MKTIDNPLDELPINYKPHYKLRYIRNSYILYGFDVFHQIASHGLDLDSLLKVCVEYHITIDWYNFTRTAIREKWMLSTLIKKIKYPIIDNYSKHYWANVLEKINYIYYKHSS